MVILDSIVSILIKIGDFVLWCLNNIGNAGLNLLIHVCKTFQMILNFIGNSILLPVIFLKLIRTFIKNIHFGKKKVEINTFKDKTPSLLLGFLTKFKFFALGIFVTMGIVLILSGNIFIHSLPDPKLIGIVNYPVSTKIYDRNDKLLYEIHADQNRTPIRINTLPDYVWKATVAIEDKSFFYHNGVSFYGGILRAVKEMVVTRRVQGGSTITQQLIKTSLLTPERTVSRKIREIILALWAENVYSKKQILEMYLNQVPYGGSSYGIEAASQTYFGHSASVLSISEAALLAGLPQAPSKYSPYSNINATKKRRNEVLHNMVNEHMITKQEYNRALQEKINVKAQSAYIRAPHFVFFVKEKLEALYGVRFVEEGGLRVKTSLDLDLQQYAQEIVKQEIDALSHLQVSNGGVVITIPQTGEILAMVGSKDYFEEPYGSYNVTTASRQPGSSIKPIMYALALQKGYTAASVLDDSPVQFTSIGSKPYKPVNYDGQYHGLVPLRYALANSYNIPAVKVLNTIGVDNFVRFGRDMGLSSLNDSRNYGLSLTLGGGEVTLIDMAVSYGVFANQGNRVNLDPILSISDYHGENLYVNTVGKEKNQIIPEGVAFIISSILSDNSAREASFGTNSQLVINGKTVAVKTGTSNNKRDNITIGYTQNYLVAVWVGNNNNQPMNQELTSGVTGAAPIWHNLMDFVLSDKYNNIIPLTDGFVKPDGIIEKQCFFGKIEYFIKGTEIGMQCSKEILVTPTVPITTPTQ